LPHISSFPGALGKFPLVAPHFASRALARNTLCWRTHRFLLRSWPRRGRRRGGSGPDAAARAVRPALDAASALRIPLFFSVSGCASTCGDGAGAAAAAKQRGIEAVALGKTAEPGPPASHAGPPGKALGMDSPSPRAGGWQDAHPGDPIPVRAGVATRPSGRRGDRAH